MKTATKFFILAALATGLSACASDGFVTDSYSYSSSAHYGPPTTSSWATVIDNYDYDYRHYGRHPRIHVHGGGSSSPHYGPPSRAAHYGPPARAGGGAHYGPPSKGAHYGPARSGGGAHYGPPRHSTPSVVFGGSSHAHYGPPSVSHAHFGPPR